MGDEKQSNGHGNGQSNGRPTLTGVTASGPGALVMNPDDPVDAPPPAEVLELAAACVRFVATRFKIEPDFTPETMPVVDEYVREARASMEDRPEALPLTANAVGAYIGEVARRCHRCWWRVEHGDPGSWRLEFSDVFLAFYPVQVAYNLLATTDEETAFSGFEMNEAERASVLERLAELPEVSDLEFYAASTRLEVLEIVVDALQGLRLADPYRRDAYRPEDYT